MMTDYEQALTVAIKALSELIEDNRKLRATIETLRESKPSTSSNQRLAFRCNSKPFAINISKSIFEGLIRECCPNLLDSTVSKLAEYLSNKISNADVISDGGDL